MAGQTNMAAEPGIGLLIRVKIKTLANRADQAMAEAPLKVIAIAVFVLFIWLSLYLLFRGIFLVLKQQALASIIAVPYVFGVFFIALMVMLMLSNAVLIYGGLFRQKESAYLLSSPARPEHIVAIKFLESLFFSSWALLLVGVPLMWAMADLQFVPWHFYPFFLSLFVLFVAIPGAWGLLTAWFVAMFLPRSLRRGLIAGGIVVGAGGIWWLMNAWQHSPADSAVWLKQFLAELRFVRSALLPSAWVTAGVTAAVENQPGRALFYLFIVFANAVFFSWLAVTLTASTLGLAYSRANGAGGRQLRGRTWASALLTQVMFFYVPARLRAIIRKDVRGFLRDPTQWAQMLILFGLLAIYTGNIPTIRLDFATPKWQLLISFLNMTAVSLILATFTSRFVFPMISLETDTMWLLGLLPVQMSRIVATKFIFALTVSLLAAVSVTLLSCRTLEVGWSWTLVKLSVAVACCIGLSGLAVGVGARLPVFGQRNTARIASGFGGTVNLILSVLFVTIVSTGFGWISLRAFQLGYSRQLDLRTVGIVVAILLFAVGVAAVALAVGARHLTRREF
ncbi:MAG TPA: hypothetical protein VMZ31_00785 [Phycisphaerae bacterium]|nr:hypothetical protein [Phycisphaerae bacterium]